MLRGDLWALEGFLRQAHDTYEAAATIARNQNKEEKWEEAFLLKQASLHTLGKNGEALDGLKPLLEREKRISLYSKGLLYRVLRKTYSSAANWHQQLS